MEPTWAKVLVWIAIAGVIGVDVLYLAIIHFQGGPGNQGPPDVLTVPFVAGYLALAGVVLALSLRVSGSARPVLRAAASAGLLGLGVIGLFSIGVLVLVFAGLATATAIAALAASNSRRVLVASAVVSVLALVILVGGLQVTSRYLVCPASGSGGGTTGGLFGQISYTCNDGRLTTG